MIVGVVFWRSQQSVAQELFCAFPKELDVKQQSSVLQKTVVPVKGQMEWKDRMAEDLL